MNISFGSTSRVVSDADRDNIVTVKRLLMIYESYWSLLFDESIGDVIVTIAWQGIMLLDLTSPTRILVKGGKFTRKTSIFLGKFFLYFYNFIAVFFFLIWYLKYPCHLSLFLSFFYISVHAINRSSYNTFILYIIVVLIILEKYYNVI